MSADLSLAARLDLNAARPLHAALLARRGDDLVIDAGRVQHLGALGLQLLLAAAQGWRQAGFAVSFARRSPEFDDALRLFGVTLDDLQAGPLP
jgi:chemotaxis protein CheX